MVRMREQAVYWRNHHAILDNIALWNDWALPRPAAYELIKCLEIERPRTIVEGGSGLSTVLLAGYAAKNDAKLVTLEHDPRYLEETKSLLELHGLAKFVDLRLVRASGQKWYDTQLPDNIDFALIDGPPEAIGRKGAMPALEAHLNPDEWTVWMTDADRPSGRACLKYWKDGLDILSKVYPLPRGLAVIKPYHQQVKFINGGGLAVTILTGGRPGLLWQMLTSMGKWAPGLLEAAHVTVLHNGEDPETVEGLRQNSHVNIVDAPSGPPLSKSGACSRLFQQIPTNLPYHLHLEDDWIVGTTFVNWLQDAKNILDRNPEVGQVRLRHRGEPVRRYSMANGKEIIWEPDQYGSLVGNAHYTLNPALMRSEDILRIWPANSEMDAVRRFRGLVAQSNPGAFHQTGTDGATPDDHWSARKWDW